MSLKKSLPFVALLWLLYLPLSASDYYVEVFAGILVFAIFAMSLDLLVGYTGLVSFGHAAYFGLGAYTLALTAPKYESANVLVSLPLAIVVSALAAFIVGLFVLRTRGTYFIMATLAFAQMFYFIFHDTQFGGGSDGVSLNMKPEIRVFGESLISLESTVHAYYLILACLVAAFIFLRLILRSPFGHAVQGIRSNEHRMVALGYPVFRYKLAGFTLAGAIAGLAGYLYTVLFGFVSPEILSWHQSGQVLLMVILGGWGSLYGAIGGAFVFTFLREAFGLLTAHWQLLMGMSIVILVLAMPGGISKFLVRVRSSNRSIQ